MTIAINDEPKGRKVAPYSFTIAHAALGMKAKVICAHSKENVSIFRYFITSTRAQKAKLTVRFLAFPSVNYIKLGRLVVKVLLKSKLVFLRSGKRHKFVKIEKPAFTNPTFCVFKTRISQD